MLGVESKWDIIEWAAEARKEGQFYRNFYPYNRFCLAVQNYVIKR